MKTTALKKKFFFFTDISFMTFFYGTDILFGALFLASFRFSPSQISDNLKQLAQMSMILDRFLRDSKKKKKAPCERSTQAGQVVVERERCQ